MNKVVDFASLKRKKIRKEFEGGVVVYNPSVKQKQKIMDLIIKNINIETDEVNLSPEDVVLRLIPILSNITIDFENKELVKEIIDDPSDILLEVIDEITIIVKNLANKMIKNVDEMSKLPKEELDKILAENSPKKTVKELEIEELEKKLNELKKVDING